MSSKSEAVSLKLLIRCDIPAKECTINIPSNASFDDLVTSVSSSLSMHSSMCRNYSFVFVKFGQEPIELNQSIKLSNEQATANVLSSSSIPSYSPSPSPSPSSPQSSSLSLSSSSLSLSSMGVISHSTICLRAPPSLRSETKRKKKTTEKPEEQDDADDKFKGITSSNVLKKYRDIRSTLNSVAANTTLQTNFNRILEFIDTYLPSILKVAREEFNNLSAAEIEEIIKRDTLYDDELFILKAMIEWGKAQIAAEKLVRNEEKKSLQNETELRNVLAPIIHHIRFPLLTPSDIAEYVCNNNLLDDTTILDLFTYLGKKTDQESNTSPPPASAATASSLFTTSSAISSSTASIPLPLSLIAFKSSARKGIASTKFKWDILRKHSNLTLSADGLTVSSTTTSYYQPIFGDKEFKNGVCEWEIVIGSIYATTNGLAIGVVSAASYSEFASSKLLGGDVSSGSYLHGWSFHPSTGHKQSHTTISMTPYGRICTSGQTIKVRLNLDKKTLEYFIDGKSIGVAFTDVVGPVRAAITMYGTNNVTLKFPRAK